MLSTLPEEPHREGEHVRVPFRCTTWTHPQDFWPFRIKTCIHYASSDSQNGTSYYNPGLKTTQSVGLQSNRCKECVQITRHPARALHPASERVPSTILCLLPRILKRTRGPKRQSRDTTAHSRYNGWKIKSTQKPGLERDTVQTVWIWQAKGGVVGLNEAASVRVGSVLHPSIPPSFHRSLSASQICRSSFHSRCQAG